MRRNKYFHTWCHAMYTGICQVINLILNSTRGKKINASTAVANCGEQWSPFGGLLGLVKYLAVDEENKHQPVLIDPLDR